MEIKFFKKHLENKDLKKNGQAKLFAGLIFIAIGLIIFFAEPSYVANGNYYEGGFGAPVKIYQELSTLHYRLITLLYVTLGKWNSSGIFYLIGLILIIWGIKGLKKDNAC